MSKCRKESRNVRIVLLIAVLMLLLSLIKQFTYYCSVRGLLYYLGTKYRDMPNEEKMKELTLMASDRVIKEFFHPSIKGR